jgi:hypothetical protein
MNLKAKIHVENQKRAAEGRLSDRLTFLQEKGLTATTIQREASIRKLKAAIRKANYRLARIAAQEKLNADKVQTKAKKLAAKKSGGEKPQAETVADAPVKKAKKEKKPKQENQ